MLEDKINILKLEIVVILDIDYLFKKNKSMLDKTNALWWWGLKLTFSENV